MTKNEMKQKLNKVTKEEDPAMDGIDYSEIPN